MTIHPAAINLLPLAAAWASGLTFGWGYFAALRRWIARYGVRGRGPRSAAAALTRVAAAVVLFTVTAHWGALALLLSFLGFLLARALALRAARASP